MPRNGPAHAAWWFLHATLATTTVLITQCLQRDNADPIGPHDPLPNLLHIRSSEAARIRLPC